MFIAEDSLSKEEFYMKKYGFARGIKDFETFIKKNIKDATDKEKCLERLHVVNENYCKKFK